MYHAVNEVVLRETYFECACDFLCFSFTVLLQ